VLGKSKSKNESDEEQANIVTANQKIKDESSLCPKYIKSVITSKN
jgi:hypothetical protein